MSMIGSAAAGASPGPCAVAPRSARLDAVRNSRRVAPSRSFCTDQVCGVIAMQTSTRIPAAVLWIAAAVAGASAFQSSIPNRPWPPAVQPMPPESNPLSPEQALQSFYMPLGYRVELVASEPLIQEPVALDWDVAGRLWAVEMPGFMADLS